MSKIAVVLFNLGGPDNLNAVQPFLFNLFNDPHIINLPAPLRFLLAKFISSRRQIKSQQIYKQINNQSPILSETTKQASALEKLLNQKNSNNKFTVFIAMNYWHPFIADTVQKVYNTKPDTIILLPLYPQYSTTTLSAFDRWYESAKQYKTIQTHHICCYSGHRDFINAHVKSIKTTLKKIKEKDFRILFSAHGLPVSIIKNGDPYQWQIEHSTKHIVTKLGLNKQQYTICYQSKVGPKKWLEPNIKDEIIKSGRKKESLIIVPISFVSEHSETLVELDIEYAKLAKQYHVPEYYRIPALGCKTDFINSLATLCMDKLSNQKSFYNTKYCPSNFCKCYQC